MEQPFTTGYLGTRVQGNHISCGEVWVCRYSVTVVFHGRVLLPTKTEPIQKRLWNVLVGL